MFFQIVRHFFNSIKRHLYYIIVVYNVFITLPCQGQQTLHVSDDVLENYHPESDATLLFNQASTVPFERPDNTHDFSVDKSQSLLAAQTAPNNYNWIRESIIRVSGKTTMSEISTLSLNHKQETWKYFDGFGRPVQIVERQASPLGRDMVQPIVYDAFGRESKKHLLYSHAAIDGHYKPDALRSLNSTGTAEAQYRTGQQYIFYQQGGLIAIDQYPYAVTSFEPSPLNRALKQGSTGAAWQPDESPYVAPIDRTVVKSYTHNVSNEVLLWTHTTNSLPFGMITTGTTASPMYYTEKKLFKTEMKDEEHKAIIEYKDKDGRLILRRVQTGTTIASTTDTQKDLNWASTYYIYDVYGNLVCVIPPEATRLITQASPASEFSGKTDDEKDDFLNRWAFRYTYDSRRRITQKKLPGAEPIYMVYDNRDRLVLTQDGNQRTGATNTIKYWTFTKYDELNRPIATGIKDTTTTIQLTQQDMQGVVDAFYARMAPAKPWIQFGEKYVGPSALNNVQGYTNYSYPVTTLAASVDPARYLTVTYYDDYSFLNDWSENYYEYTTDGVSTTSLTGNYNQAGNNLYNKNVKGLITGTKIKVLDGGVAGSYTWLKSVNYYDDKYRTIQIQSDNLKGGIDRVSNVFDFTGKVLKTKTTHTTQDVSWKDVVGARLQGNKLIRTTPSSGWGTSGACSAELLQAGQDGWIEFMASEIDTYRMIGLSDSNEDAHYTTIDYALYLRANNQINIYENGVSRGVFGFYKGGDVFKINRTGNTITYHKNGTLLYTSTITSSTQLLVDVAFNELNATITGMPTSFSTKSNAVARTFEYDHAGRLTHTWHQLDNVPTILLSKNEYNEIGQLIDKKLHSTNSHATDAKQSVDYRYNIRGWLTSLNNSTLTNDNGTTNDDAGDYFGMNLGYNNDIDIGNTAMFNGNISGLKWNNFLGTGSVKEKSYTYKYDALNRLTGSYYKERTSDWDEPSNNGFDERGFGYDLNGNITKLTRFDKSVVGFMDSLVYSYGTGATQSNKLLRVTDFGDDYKGFVDGHNGTANDYTYDANGNMTRDLNKGIGTSLTDVTNQIKYNYLNLPETVTKAGLVIRYLYDATGRKLAQNVSMGGSTKQTDYAGEFIYENGVLQFINHEEGRVITASDKLIYKHAGETIEGITASNGVTLAPLTQKTDEKYIKISSSSIAIQTGVFPVGAGVSVLPGERYRIRVKGYRTTTAVHLLLKINGNVLAWPGATVPFGSSAETWTEQTITIPANVTTPAILEAGLAWNAASTTEQIIYLNEFEITKLETTAPEYQYHLKDHLGNVRLTFTTKQETENATATMEAANTNTEQGKFVRYEHARFVNHHLFDKNNGSAPTTVAGRAQRLNGKDNEVYGLGRTLSVIPGDVIDMEVHAKYIDSNNINWTEALSTLLEQIANGATPVGTVVDGGGYGSSTSSFPYAANLNGTNSSTGTGPKAYLNWLVFDRDYKVIASKSGYKRMTTVAREHGQNVAHEKLNGSVTISEPGYVYIYISNEGGASSHEVYFDEFKVTQTKSPIVQMDDYYAFGLAFNSYNRENSISNVYKYNSKENQDELGLNWLDYGARMFDPVIARFSVTDRFSETYYGLSPYHYVANNPANSIDKNGDFIVSIHYKITEDVLKKYGYSGAASRLAWYSSYYADNPSTLILVVNNLYALATGLPVVQYRQQIGRETADSQNTGSPIESQRHSMTGDFEDDISKAEATKRGQEFGWKNIFKAAAGGTPNQYEQDSKEDKAFGVGIHALQDSKAHEGVQMKEHKIKKDMGKGDKGVQAWESAKSISESAVMVVEMLNNNFSHINNGTKLDVSGMNKDQLQKIIDAAVKSKKNVQFVNEN